MFAVLPSQDVNPDYYTTQTVYGFLDFTTTIGNTVMIFSPQSAAPAVTGNSVLAFRLRTVSCHGGMAHSVDCSDRFVVDLDDC